MNNKLLSSIAQKFSLALAAFCLCSFAIQTNAQKRRAAGIQARVPVVLIHGIGGADLDYRPRDRGLWSNGFPNDVLKAFPGEPQNLQFDASGNPRSDTISKSIKAVKFYDVPGSRNITDLSEFLRKNGYVKNATLFEFFYDFRFSVQNNAVLLDAFVNRIKTSTKAAQVDVVAHSLGGMIAKQYLIDNGANAANIRRLLFIGTPHLGAPKALKVLRYGDNLDVPVIDGCKMKRVAHNLPSMFNLLPGRRYVETVGGYFDDADDTDGDGVRGVLDFEKTIYNLVTGKETRCLLKSKIDAAPFDGLSADLIDVNLVNFHKAQDDWTKPAGVEVYMIVGYGVPTLKMLAENKNQISLTYTTEGDGTVPLRSSEAAEADQIYYVNLMPLKSDHSQMIGNEKIDFQIFNLLQTGTGKYIEEVKGERPSKFEETVVIEK